MKQATFQKKKKKKKLKLGFSGSTSNLCNFQLRNEKKINVI